jgi:twitching motility protein PilI
MTGTTTSGADSSLRSLRDRPFELLKELEKRSRSNSASNAPDTAAGQEWVGVAFRMGGETFLAAREETREVLGYPAVVTRIPGAKNWVKGLANIRGQLLPMLDLRQFLGSGATTPGRNTRIVVVNHREIPAGLMVDEVLGFRRFSEPEFNAEPPPTVIRCDSYLAGAFRRGGEVWPVLSLKNLVESQSFLQAAS